MEITVRNTGDPDRYAFEVAEGDGLLVTGQVTRQETGLTITRITMAGPDITTACLRQVHVGQILAEVRAHASKPEPTSTYTCAHGYAWVPKGNACPGCIAQEAQPHPADPIAAQLQPRLTTKYWICRQCTQAVGEEIHQQKES